MNKKLADEIALFRYSLIAAVLHDQSRGQRRYFREISKKQFKVPGRQEKKAFSVSCLKTWLRLYRTGGIDALYPSTRSDAGTSKKISLELAEKIRKVIADYPYLSCAGIYQLLVRTGEITKFDFTEATLRNYISKNSLKTKNSQGVARKKFEMPAVNMLWVADFMHGPYLIDTTDHNRKKKTYLCAIIDDHSRLIVGARFFFAENSLSLATVLKAAILQHGICQKFYCDNGSVFSTSYLNLACARVGIALVHSKAYDSPSRGKIERAFRTVKSMFLAALKLDNIKSIDSLNEHFTNWLSQAYHQRIHGGTTQKPLERFLTSLSHTTVKRIAEHELDRAFYGSFERLVKNDSTISYQSKSYEAPPEYIGYKVEIRFPLDKPEQLTLYHDNQPISELKLVNLTENAQKPYTAIHFNKNLKGEDK